MTESAKDCAGWVAFRRRGGWGPHPGLRSLRGIVRRIVYVDSRSFDERVSIDTEAFNDGSPGAVAVRTAVQIVKSNPEADWN